MLPPDEDPFRRILLGAQLSVTLLPPRHMTYGILKNVMRGLLDVLVVGEEDCEATFLVWHSHALMASGRVANATIVGDLTELPALAAENDIIKSVLTGTEHLTDVSKP